MSDDNFEDRRTELLNSDAWSSFLGIQRGARYHTKAGVSSLYSEVYFLNEVEEDDLQDVSDFILSDTLQKNLESTIMVCVHELRTTKYVPSQATVGARHGAVSDDEREGVFVEAWEDFEIPNAFGQPLYTEDMLKAAQMEGEGRFGAAMWLVVRDICDSGEFLSENWYQARIVYEYFREYPVPADNAFLIGELFKELCAKQIFEGDLGEYYQGLIDASEKRKKGTEKVKEKAQELRDFCVELFAEMAVFQGPRLTLAPPDIQAKELRNRALELRPDDFVRAGKPYAKEWFLRNIIEDRKLEIVQSCEARQSN